MLLTLLICSRIPPFLYTPKALIPLAHKHTNTHKRVCVWCMCVCETHTPTHTHKHKHTNTQTHIHAYIQCHTYTYTHNHSNIISLWWLYYWKKHTSLHIKWYAYLQFLGHIFASGSYFFTEYIWTLCVLHIVCGSNNDRVLYYNIQFWDG